MTLLENLIANVFIVAYFILSLYLGDAFYEFCNYFFFKKLEEDLPDFLEVKTDTFFDPDYDPKNPHLNFEQKTEDDASIMKAYIVPTITVIIATGILVTFIWYVGTMPPTPPILPTSSTKGAISSGGLKDLL